MHDHYSLINIVQPLFPTHMTKQNGTYTLKNGEKLFGRYSYAG